jgi:hypothetical protein
MQNKKKSIQKNFFGIEKRRKHVAAFATYRASSRVPWR